MSTGPIPEHAGTAPAPKVTRSRADGTMPRRPGRPTKAEAEAKRAAAGVTGEPSTPAAIAEAVAAATTPPPTASGPGRPTALSAQGKQIAETMTVIYVMLGGGLVILGSRVKSLARLVPIGLEVTANAEPIGKAYGTWAQTNKKVLAKLQDAGTGLTLVGLCLAHAPIIFAGVTGEAGGEIDLAALEGLDLDGLAGEAGGGIDITGFLAQMAK